MTMNKLSNEQSCVIRIDIDGEKHRLELTHSSTAAELRNILTERYHISFNTHFLDSEGYTLFPGDEQSITINQLLMENNIVRLITDKNKSNSIPILEMNSKVFDKKPDLTYPQSSKTSFHELKLPSSTVKTSQNKVIIATDLDSDMWRKVFNNCNLLYGIRMDTATPVYALRPIFKFQGSINNIPLFKVNDGSYTSAYMNDKEMQSSFVSSKFFESGIQLSTPYIGIGINEEYFKTKTILNTEQIIYLTCCFNYPRVTLELDLSYLEITSQFLQAIDNVLSIVTLDEQIIKLKEVLSIYGHVYPCSIVLGGHLYHTEIHMIKNKSQAEEKRIKAAMSFSTAIMQAAKIHIGGGNEKKSEDNSSEQNSLTILKAVGGDTLLNRDPTLWANTVADPFLWRIIEQDNYQSVITLLDSERQQKIQKIFNYYTEKEMSVNMSTKWKIVETPVVENSNKRNTSQCPRQSRCSGKT